MILVVIFSLSLLLASSLGASERGNNLPIITHLSHPAYPDETVLVSGGPFSDNCIIRLSPTSKTYHQRVSSKSSTSSSSAAPSPAFYAEVKPLPGQTTENGLAFIVPSDLPLDVYQVSIGRCSSPVSPFSDPVFLNAPQLWWAQGNLGDKASIGVSGKSAHEGRDTVNGNQAESGWIRVHGVAMMLDVNASTLRLARSRLRKARDYLTSLPMSVDLGLDDDSPLISAIREYLAARDRLLFLMKTPRNTPLLRLTPANGQGPSIDLEPVLNFTAYGGMFLLPSSIQALTDGEVKSAMPALKPSTYNISFSNGYGVDPVTKEGPLFVPLHAFIDPAHPDVYSIEILAKPEWPPSTFFVKQTSTPCVIGLPNCTTSDEALATALSQASSAGGGTIYFPRGTYYLHNPINVPPNTRLMGERTDLVSIYFSERTPATAPFSFIALDESQIVGEYGGASTPDQKGICISKILSIYIYIYIYIM